MPAEAIPLTTWSHALAAAVYAAFALHLRHRSEVEHEYRRAAQAFFAAIVLTALWGAAGLASSVTPLPWLEMLGRFADTLRYAAWFVFLLALLRPPGKGTTGSASAWGLPASAALLVAAALASQAQISGLIQFPALFNRTPAFVLMGMTVMGLFLLEQLFRNVHEDSRWNAKPLCLGLGGVFAFDFYAYSTAALFNTVDPDVAPVRGIIQALMALLLVLSTTRRANWITKLRVSRKAAFHSASLLAAGGYLIFISIIGYYIRYFGGEWGRALQLTIIFVALVALVVIALSGTIRAKLRVMLGKHFFRYQYDYREEWLNFTKTLASQESPEAMGRQLIHGLADMVESPAGALWLCNQAQTGYQVSATWNFTGDHGEEAADSGFIAYLVSTGWVVNLDEYRNTPARYGGLVLPAWLVQLPQAWLIVPLWVGDTLIGFVLLTQPRTKMDVNWEVTDLLKVAGRQAASVLAQMQATEALLEARKFEAFNRMSAFVVHDLKNIVTQLSLMLKNAQRLQHNPEFQSDMLMTVQNSLDRMRQMMAQLREGATAMGGSVGIDTHALARRILTGTSARGLNLDLDLHESATARGDEARLERIIGHLVQNAFDASAPGGRVSLRIGRSGGSAQIVVSDSGHGMSEAFIRDQLFRPFQTTKADGMGIGSFESFQYVKELGGTINVVSEPQAGTAVTVLLPLLDTRPESDLHMLKAP